MLELDGLTKRYEEILALDDCSFTAAPGRLTGFLGPNGAGKTTAMRCVFGLVVPDSGVMRWQGRPLDADTRARFGYMPEERGLYPRMRVGDQVAYFGRLAGMDKIAAAKAARHWLDRLGLADRLTDRVSALSHGNQQRVQLAVCLVADPQVLLLDEPFSGLDPLAIDALGGLLREQAEQGVAVLFSSHQLDLVEELCDDVVIIHEGRVRLAGSLEEVRATAGHRVVDLMVAGAPPEWVPKLPDVDVVSRHDGHLRLRVPNSMRVEELLARIHPSGEVTRLRYEPPPLSELFREAVSR